MAWLAALAASSWPGAQMDSGSAALLKLLVIAPAVEEAFFRGVVQATLLGRTDALGRPVAANLITALLFGAAHLLAAPALHAAAVVLPALAIGALYQRQRSIAACALAHAAFNTFYLLWSH